MIYFVLFPSHSVVKMLGKCWCSFLHDRTSSNHMESVTCIWTAGCLDIKRSFYLTFEEMQLLWGKPQIWDKAVLQISVLSKWHLFSSSPLTAPAGADKPQIVVQSATDADSDGWFDPLSYTRSLRCHQFFRAQKCINRRVLQTPLKSPDEDKIHTNMHEHPTHTHGPWALNHEWDQTPILCRNETRPGKMAYNAASLITWAVTSFDLQTPARLVFSCMWSSSHGSECLQSFKIHFLVVLQLRLVVGNVKFPLNPAYFGSPHTWIKDLRSRSVEEWRW